MNKVIVITGASDGLGKATAKLLSKDNTVIIVSRNEDKLISVSNELNCSYKVCDVTDYNQVQDTINSIVDEYGKIDVLINNAGVWLAGDLNDNDYESISKCIDVNTKGPIFMTKAVLKDMYNKKEGLIINVCSQASFDSDDFSPVYNASKWAMRGFNRSMIKAVSKNGVKITGFYPGFMQTNLFKKAGNDYDTSTGLEVEKVAKAIEFIVNCEDDILVTELGIKDIENY